MCVSSANISVIGSSVAKHTESSVGPENVAEAVGAARSDRMTSRAAAKAPDIFVGSLQKHVSGSGSASTAERPTAQALY